MQEKGQRGRRVRLQFVLGSHSASIHPATGASNWIAEGQVGSGRGWGLEENREQEGGVGGREERARGRGVMGCKECRGSLGKMGRLLTSHHDTNKVKRVERRGG